MQILVLNGGSSSIKFSILDVIGKAGSTAAVEPRLIFDGELSGIGTGTAKLRLGHDAPKAVSSSSMDEASREIFKALDQRLTSAETTATIEAVGYRVVHPGPKIRSHTRISEGVLAELAQAAKFAPLHNPSELAMIREGMRHFSAVNHYACFDTIFHQTMPEAARTYALPAEYREKGLERYGFHGLSCEWVVRRLRATLPEFPRRLTIAHLGSGCSVTAVVDGESIENTMGLTPTGGVVMGTRPGDLDPGLMLYLLRDQQGRAQQGQQQGPDAIGEVESMINHSAGVVALSEMPNDMKATREAAGKGEAKAVLAVDVFTRSVRKAMGAFHWLMGGTDAIVFTGGIGEHDSGTRSQVLAGLEGMGIAIEMNQSTSNQDVKPVHAASSRTAVYVVTAQEDAMIAVHVEQMARSLPEVLDNIHQSIEGGAIL